MFCILVFLLSLSFSVESSSLESINKHPLPPGVIGPESFAFMSINKSSWLVTGVADGRILKSVDPALGFQDYVYTAPNRSKAVCDGYNGNIDRILGPKCGRPLGIAYNRRTEELYAADAYVGFVVIRRNEMIPRVIANSAGGVRFGLPDGLDIDQGTGNVYFTDASAKFGLSQIAQAVAVNDSTGRLLKYDPQTRKVTVLMTGLSGPAGVAVSKNGSFLFVTEFIAKRIRIYYLTGPKANTSEIALNLTGRPDNIKSTASPNEFLVAMNELILPSTGYKIATGVNGTKVVKKYDFPQYTINQVSEVNPVGDDTVYTGSMTAPFVGDYKEA